MIFYRISIVCIIILFGSRQRAGAELVRIYGSVTDSVSKELLQGVRIELRELKRGIVSKKDGSFEIRDIAHGIYTVFCFAPGYQEYSRRIDIHENLRIDIGLIHESIKGKEVVITSTRHEGDLTLSSHSVSIIEAVELDEHRGQTLGETLKDIPGVTLLQTGASISKPVIRGLHSDRVLVLNAGVKQEGQQWGAEHAPELDPFAASTIEVTKGASGVEFGAGAIGGVINVEPRILRTSGGFAGEFDVNGFSNNGQVSSSLLLETPIHQFDGWGIRAQLSGRYAGDSRAPDYVIGNTGFRELNGSFNFGYKTIEKGVELYYSHFGTELGIYKGSHFGNKDDLLRAIASDTPLVDYTFTYEIDPPKQVIAHDLLSLKGFVSIENIGKLEMIYGYQKNNREEYDAHINRFTTPRPGEELTPATELILSTYSLETKLHHNPIGTLYGTIGLSVDRQNNSIGGKSVLIPPYQKYAGGAYFIENYLLGSLSLEAGIRYDYQWMKVESSIKNSEQITDNSSVSGSFGAILQFADEWSIASNLSSAWRPPSVNELYSYGVHHGTAQFEIGDSTLSSERSYDIDLTLRHQSAKARIEVSAYYNYFNNYIYLQPDSVVTITIRGAYPTFRYSQSAARIFGVDLLAEYQLFEPLKIGVTLAILQGDNLNLHEPLYQMPSARIRGMLHYDLPFESEKFSDSYLEFSVRSVAQQKHVAPNTDFASPPEGYTLLDLRGSSQIHIFGTDVSTSLAIENILNTSYRDYLSRYRYFTDEPGRNVILRISVPFGDFHDE